MSRDWMIKEPGKSISNSTGGSMEMLANKLTVSAPGNIPMEGKKFRERYRIFAGTDKRTATTEALIPACSRPVVAISFGRRETKRAADSIGRKDMEFFIDTLLTGIWRIWKGQT